jgi:cephalosporin hydroxylase
VSILRDGAKRWQMAVDAGIHVRQGKAEFLEVYERLQKSAPERQDMIEVGALQGGSALVFAGLLAEGSKVTLIDLLDRGEKSTANLWKSISMLEAEGFDVILIASQSQNPATLDQVHDRSTEYGAGLIHVDGCHHWAVVIADFQNYLPYLAPGGSIVFHDVVAPGGVRKAWQESIVPQADGQGLTVQVVGGEQVESKWASGIGIITRNGSASQ